MKKNIYFILVGLCLFVNAQQDPLYSLYMTNMQAINPAYAGIHSNLVASVNYRSQWVNLPQNPVTMTAGVHSSLFQDYVGGGIMVVQDQIGVVKNNETYLMGSYQIGGDEFKLSFGLQFGMLSQRFDYSMLSLDPVAADPLLAESPATTKLNFGTGLAFISDAVFIGVSIPRIAQPVMSSDEISSLPADKTVYITGSSIFPLDVETELQPSFLIRYAGSSNFSYDAGVNWVYNRFFIAGLFTRELSSFGDVVGLRLMNKLDVRYSFEAYTQDFDGLNNYAHELSLKFNFSVFPWHDEIESIF
ncbi:MAG: type IX secretion system membrane protein PorP/SprF [Ekhidna sp.]